MLACCRNIIIRRERLAYSHSFSTSQQSAKPRRLRIKWFGIPMTLGVACIGVLQFRRVLWRERDNPASPQPMTWQV